MNSVWDKLTTKPDDQNQPLLWGLQQILDMRNDAMRDPGRFGSEYGANVRQQNEEHENNLMLRNQQLQQLMLLLHPERGV